MVYADFLERVIADGIAAAKADYSEPNDEPKLRGSIQGFEACRHKTWSEIALLLQDSCKKTHDAMARNYEGEISDREYWIVRCRETEIEWVANVVSAMLVNEGLPPIFTPTVRGAKKAAEILGVQKGKP